MLLSGHVWAQINMCVMMSAPSDRQQGAPASQQPLTLRIKCKGGGGGARGRICERVCIRFLSKTCIGHPNQPVALMRCLVMEVPELVCGHAFKKRQINQVADILGWESIFYTSAVMEEPSLITVALEHSSEIDFSLFESGSVSWATNTHTHRFIHYKLTLWVITCIS